MFSSPLLEIFKFCSVTVFLIQNTANFFLHNLTNFYTDFQLLTFMYFSAYICSFSYITDKKIARERILSELDKMLNEDCSLRAVVLMYYMNILSVLFIIPNIDEMYLPSPGWSDPGNNFKYVSTE